MLTFGDRPPVFQGTPPSVADVFGGLLFTCALLVDGQLRCWGAGDYGKLGYGNTENIGDDETPASAGNVDVF